jgi:hypothetical protein
MKQKNNESKYIESLKNLGNLYPLKSTLPEKEVMRNHTCQVIPCR